MSRRLTCVCVLLLLPALVRADNAAKSPEHFLSARSLFYFRYDGLDEHRKAYDKTVMAEVMNGDLGEFVDYLVSSTKTAIGPAILKDKVLEGSVSKRLQQMRKGFKQTPDGLRYLGRSGLVVGGELITLYPFRAQLTVVYPNGGADKIRDMINANLRLVAALADVPIKENTKDGRTFYQWDLKTTVPKVLWWQEGKHVVLTVGTEEPAYTMEIVSGKNPNLLTSPLYQALQKFNRYETVARGFVDLERPLKLARFATQFAQAGKILDDVGLSHLKSLSGHFGFEGRHLRSTIVLKAPPPRKGVFNLSTATTPIDIETLPPLPPDMGQLVAMHLDPSTVYDLALNTVIRSAESGNKDARKQIEDTLRKLDERLGIELRKDLLGSLGSTVVVYNSPSEGPMSLGFGVAIKAKDPGRLRNALDNLFKSLPVVFGEDISLHRQTYCGVDLYTAKMVQQGFFIVPSYCIHQDWFVLGMFPQTVQGYLARATKKYSCWEPTPLVGEVLRTVKRETPDARIVAVSVADPRPTLKHLCSIGPVIFGLADSFDPGSFDVKKIPNAQVLTEPLYPNVSVLVDDGDEIRLESYSSFALPMFDLTGLDGYFTAFIAFQIFRLMG